MKLPFSARTAQRLMKIYRNPFLSNPTHESVLPPHWGTLYALSQLPERELDFALKTGTLKPDMERKDVAKLINYLLPFSKVPPAVRALHHFMQSRKMSGSELAREVWEDPDSDQLLADEVNVMRKLPPFVQEFYDEYARLMTEHHPQWDFPPSKTIIYDPEPDSLADEEDEDGADAEEEAEDSR